MKQTIESMAARVKDATTGNAWTMVESTMSSVIEGRVSGCVQDMDVALESAQTTICSLMAMVLNKSREIEQLNKKASTNEERATQYCRWWNESEEKAKKSENKLAVIRQMLDIMK